LEIIPNQAAFEQRSQGAT